MDIRYAAPMDLKCLHDLGVENFLNYVAVDIVERLPYENFAQGTISAIEMKITDVFHLLQIAEKKTSQTQ